MSLYEEHKLTKQVKYLLSSDIHGHYSELMHYLDGQQFSDTDHLYLVGDHINRGKENLEMMKFIKSENVTALAGNHELKLLDYFDGKLDSDNVIRSGGYWFTQLNRDHQEELADQIREMPIAVKVTTPGGRTRGLVHAACYPDSWDALVSSLAEEEPRRTRNVINSLTDRAKFNSGEHRFVEGIDWVVVGHNPVEAIGSLGNTLYVDCGLYLGGELAMIDLISLAKI